MKIGAQSSPAADAAALSRANAEAGAAAAKAGGKKPAAADATGSSVQLSSTAASLLAANASTPEFDAAKVEKIKQAIADGSYKVNPEAIADKLLSNAQELLSSAGRSSR
jgi:negative regulator of flagellin synthesis FlgM